MLQDVIALLGIANPQLSLKWQDGSGLPSESAGAPMQLTSNSSNGEWLAPVAGQWNQAFAGRLSMPDGSVPGESTWVLALYPQVGVRLSRLYGVFLEGRSTQTDRVQRPVPRYFAFHNTSPVGEGPTAGTVSAGTRLKLAAGRMSIHDETGEPIDALATAAAFTALINAFPALAAKDFAQASAPDISNSQIGQLAAGLNGAELRVRLVSFFRKPFTGGANKLSNLTAIDTAAGLYRFTNPAQAVLVVSPPANPNENFAVGPASFGTVDTSFNPQPLGAAIPLSTLKRDFLTLLADDLNLHLRGGETFQAPFAGQDSQIPVFHNESVDLLANGNQIMARAGQVIANADGLFLAVAPVINGDFELAPDPAQAEWPAFPAGGSGPIAGRLKDLVIRAHFLATPAADPRDVYLEIEFPELSPGLPQLAPGTAVRVYNRKFLADAREGRGNGSGGILDANRRIGFVLTNPFGLRRNEAIPANPQLSFDLIAVNRDGSKRSFGLLGTEVEASRNLNATESVLADRGSNLFNTAPELGIAPAGLLGLPAPALNLLPSISDLASAVDVALSLGQESQPRIAPRLPTMTRNESLVAGRDTSGNWSAVLSGLWLRRDSRSSLHRFGSPGSPGGEEFLGAGVHTRNGLLAYELARMAFRRTRGLVNRLSQLDADARWEPPVSPASNGTFSVGLLQNIASGADSPNLKLIPDAAFNTMPNDWTSLVNALSPLPSGQGGGGQGDPLDALASSPKGLLLYGEFRREAVTARHGRRDALPVLSAALKAARHLIYVETSAFSFTDYQADGDPLTDPPNEATDLVSIIADRMNTQPGLQVLIGVNKEVPVGIGYESFAARAFDRRKRALDKLKSIDDGRRVTLFHPIGYPGRPVRLMHTVVIVDDMWLFIGSGSFNRRGLLFDGNLSLVCFDRQIEAGRSQAIRNFRQQLLSNHLGANPLPGSPPDVFPNPNLVRLADLHESFFAVREMQEQGGSGLLQPLFDGKVTGQPVISPASFPHRDLADPDGLSFASTSAALLQLFAGLGESEA